jgi:GT2 family glycosyltransferase
VTPQVSVVVPTVDRVPLLARCLRGLALQRGVDWELLVVHDGDDGVTRLLAEHADRLPLTAVRSVQRTAPAKRNLGWARAIGEFVAFTDDDCEPAPGWLAAAVRAFADGVDLVQGRVDPHPEDRDVSGLFARTVRVERYDDVFPNANLVFRRSALDRVDGYDERLTGGEDTDLAWRVLESGGRGVYADDALVYHAVRAVSFADHLRSLPRWSTLPLVVHRHPRLRERAYRRYFWKSSHPAAVLALAGLAAGTVDRRALVLTAPLLWRRLGRRGVRAGAQLAVADVVEALVLVAGSARHRSVLL